MATIEVKKELMDEGFKAGDLVTMKENDKIVAEVLLVTKNYRPNFRAVPFVKVGGGYTVTEEVCCRICDYKLFSGTIKLTQ